MYNLFARKHPMLVHCSRVIVCVWLLVLPLSSVFSLPLYEPHPDCLGVSPPVSLHRSRRNVLSAGYSLVKRSWRPSFIRRIAAMGSLWGSFALKAEEESIKSSMHMPHVGHMPHMGHMPGVKHERESLVKRIKNYISYKMKPGAGDNPVWGTAVAQDAMESLPMPHVEQIPIVKEQRDGVIKKVKNYIVNKIKSMVNPTGPTGTLVKDTIVQVGLQRAIDAASNWLEDQQNGNGQSQEEEDETPRRAHYQQQGHHLQQMVHRGPLQQETHLQEPIQSNQLEQDIKTGQLEQDIQTPQVEQMSQRDPLQVLQQVMNKGPLQHIQQTNLEQNYQKGLVNQQTSLPKVDTDNWNYWLKPEMG